MEYVYKKVEELVKNEITDATERLGLYHSWHEKYAVMLEELEELENEVRCAKDCLNSIWFGVKNDSEDFAEEAISKLYDRTVKSACEAIHVAAMAKKEIEEPKEITEPVKLNDHGLYSGHDPVRVFRCTNCGSDFVAGIHPHPFYCPRCGKEFSNVLRF